MCTCYGIYVGICNNYVDVFMKTSFTFSGGELHEFFFGVWFLPHGM